MRGELMQAAEIAETFAGEAEKEARATEAGEAHRFLGYVRFLQGDFHQAQAMTNGRADPDFQCSYPNRILPRNFRLTLF
jgi:hypothetical protein